MFTVCNKRGPSHELTKGPDVYLRDPMINAHRPSNVLYSSLPGGISRQTTPASLIDLESNLRGQNSDAQFFCQAPEVPTEQQMPWRFIPKIEPTCFELPTQLPNQCFQSREVQWLDRNVVPPKCTAPRMMNPFQVHPTAFGLIPSGNQSS